MTPVESYGVERETSEAAVLLSQMEALFKSEADAKREIEELKTKLRTVVSDFKIFYAKVSSDLLRYEGPELRSELNATLTAIMGKL